MTPEAGRGEGAHRYRQLDCRREDNVVIITVNRPEVRNALSLAAMTELERALETVAADRSVRGLVVTGSGDKAFISGGDVADLQRLKTEEQAREMARQMQQTLTRLAGLEIPTVAAINGHAVGGGCEVAVACDFRIAVRTARLGFRQVKIGITTAWGGGPRLFHLLGRARALRLLLTGELVDAPRALDLGLVDEVVGCGQALARALELAGAMSANPPLAVRAYKRLARVVEEEALAAAMRAETELFVPLWVSEDHDEAVAAMQEKRTPHFTGH